MFVEYMFVISLSRKGEEIHGENENYPNLWQFSSISDILQDFHFLISFFLHQLSKITQNCPRFGTHFSQIVEDFVSDCQRLRSSRSRSRNSFSSFNSPPCKLDIGLHIMSLRVNFVVTRCFCVNIIKNEKKWHRDVASRAAFENYDVVKWRHW